MTVLPLRALAVGVGGGSGRLNQVSSRWGHQSLAIREITDAIAGGRRRVMLSLPTGAGKTRIAASLIRAGLGSGERAIFVTPRLVLIEQTIRALRRAGIPRIGVIQGSHPRTDPHAPVQVASAQTLSRRDIPRSSLVVIDECHGVFASIRKWLADPEWSDIPFIGMTATPWTRGLGKIYHHLIQPTSIPELIERGVLCRFRVLAPPGPSLGNVRTLAGDFNEADLSAACDQIELVADIVRTWIEKGEGRATLCYGVDRAHARHLQERFTEAGVAAEYIDCTTPLFEREKIFGRFRSSETKVICNVATLDTGLDLDVRCIIDARPTKSKIRFVQTIGRGLRASGDKAKLLLVLDHAGNHRRLGLVTGIQSDVLDDGDRRRGVERDVKGEPHIKLCQECHCVLALLARECPQCGAVIGKGRPVVEREGELVELGRAPTGSVGERHAHQWAERDLWHGALAQIANERGYRAGWVSHKYREKFGQWPTLNFPPEQEPTAEILTWVRARAAEYAKSVGGRRYG